MILKKARNVFGIITLFMLCLGTTVQTNAKENYDFQLSYNGYCLNDYEISVIVNQDASMDITEHITADFVEPKHGIYRAIPIAGKMSLNYEDVIMQKNYLANISNISVRDATTKQDISHSLRSDDGILIIKVGDSDKTLTGKNTYELSYHYALKTGPDTAINFLTYNLIGTGWDTSINNIHFAIDMPSTFDANKLMFFSGSTGSIDTSGISYRVTDNQITGNVDRILDPTEGLTVQFVLPEGYFQIKNDNVAFVETILFILLAGISILLWEIYGRYRRVHITIVDAPPKQYNPAEISYVLTNTVNERAVSAMLLYWANLGFIRIVDQGKHVLQLIKQRQPDDTLHLYEKQMLDKLFDATDTVVASQLKEDFYKTVQVFQAAVKEEFQKSNPPLFETKSITAILAGYCISASILTILTFQAVSFFGFGIGGFIFAFFISFFVWVAAALCAAFLGVLADRLQIGFYVGFVIWAGVYGFALWLFASAVGKLMLQPELYSIASVAAGMSALAGAFSNRRTPYGAQLLGEVLSYRRYISQKIHSAQLKSNEQDTFYRDFAYTFVFGLSKKWAASLGKITVMPPSWYVAGQTTGFETMYFMRQIEKGMNGYQSVMSSSDSSSSGGGAGGGAGGGGGGSW